MTDQKRKTTAYSYSRVSSLGQVTGTGIERQIEAARAYCLVNNLILSDEIFSDEGKSAFHGKNLTEDSRLSAFIHAVKIGKVKKGSVLIVEALDRISREEMGEAVTLFQSILKTGIEIVTLSDGRRYTAKSSLTDWIISLVGFQAANDYSAKLSSRVSAAWKKKQKTGDRNKPSHPSWLKFNKETNSFSIIEAKAAIVKRIFNEFNNGAGYSIIAKGLNRDKIRTAKGKAWSNINVKFILRSYSVIGEYRPKTRGQNGEKLETDIVHQNYYPAIISEDEFYKAYNRIKNNPPKEGGKMKDETANLFQGLFKCGYCGSTMGFAVKKNLVCWNSLNNSQCVRYAWDYNEFELPLLAEVKEVFEERKSELNIPVKVEIEGLQGKVEEIKTRTKRLSAQLEILDEVSDIVSRINDLNKEKSKIESEIKEKEALNEELKSTGTNFLNFGFHVDSKNNAERREIQRIIRNHIKEIIVFPAGEDTVNEEYRKLRDQLVKAGKNIHSVNKELVKRLKPDKRRYMSIELKNPVMRNGIPVKYFKVKVEATEPTIEQIRGWDLIEKL